MTIRLLQGPRIPVIAVLRVGMRQIGGKAARLIMAMLHLIEAWRARSSQRRRLSALDDRLLKDFGVSRCDAEAESRKPFWRP
jgi:uncharacterized protein YjiS (DUF1127 family)